MLFHCGLMPVSWPRKSLFLAVSKGKTMKKSRYIAAVLLAPDKQARINPQTPKFIPKGQREPDRQTTDRHSSAQPRPLGGKAGVIQLAST
jgi:hypothetical protein